MKLILSLFFSVVTLLAVENSPYVAQCPTGYELDTSVNYVPNGDFSILVNQSNVSPNTWLSNNTWKSDAYYHKDKVYPNDSDQPTMTTESINSSDILWWEIGAFRFDGNSKYNMSDQNYLYFNGNDLGRVATVWQSKSFSIDKNEKYIFVAHVSNVMHRDKYTEAADPKVQLSFYDSSWHSLGNVYEIPRDSTQEEGKSSDKWYEISHLIEPTTSSISLKITDSAYEKGAYGDDLVVSGIGLYKCKPTSKANAMLLTRGDNENNDKTNVYVFHVDTQTDTITDFKLLKKLDVKFRSLVYKDGHFYTIGNTCGCSHKPKQLYEIDINTGNYTEVQKLDNLDDVSLITALDFDEDGNILYNIWDSDTKKMRNIYKYNITTKTSSLVATVPSGDVYADGGIAYYGAGKFANSVDGGARYITNGNLGDKVFKSGLWCVYGGEYVGDDKSYFLNAVSSDKSIYKLVGSIWTKIYDYGAKTGIKGIALAVVHGSIPTQETKDFGDAPNQYTHASHIISDKLYFGNSKPDAENEQQSSESADGDGDDDSDGIVEMPTFIQGDTYYSIKVKVFNNTGKKAYITAWIDFNQDGIFQFGEALNNNNLYVNSSNKPQTITVTWDNSEFDDIEKALSGKTYLRIRVSTDRILRCQDEEYHNGHSVEENYLVAPDGEVEDYVITIENTPPTIIADYHFDECSWDGTAEEVKDSSGNGFHGTAYKGANTFDDAKKINRSGKFIKSKGQYVKVTNMNNFDRNSFSVSLWVKIHKNVSGWQTILHKGDTGNHSNGVFRIKYNYNNGNDKLGIYSTSSNGNWQNFYKYNVGLKDMQWHHLVVTYKDHKFTVYLDKNQVAEHTYSGGLASPNQEFHIGGKYYKSNMYIDEVKVYQGALNTTQIQTIYNNENAGKNYDGTNRAPVNCNQPTEGICYALDDTGGVLYSTYLNPGASTLPTAKKITLNSSVKFNAEAEAFNSVDGKIYAFYETGSDPKLYTIDPDSGNVEFVTTLSGVFKNVSGASFYDGYLYVLGKYYLYKIDTKDWSIKKEHDLYGDTSDADGLAINENGQAYVIKDKAQNNSKKPKLYSINIDSSSSEFAKTSYLADTKTLIEGEALSFAKDGNLYTEDSDDASSNDSDIIYKIDSDGTLTPAAQIPHGDNIDIEGLSCNVIHKPTPPTCEEKTIPISNGNFDDAGDGWATDWTVDGGLNPSSSYNADGQYVFLWDQSKVYRTIDIEPNTDYILTFMSAYSVKKDGMTDCGDNSYKGQYVQAKFNNSGTEELVQVKHWVCEDSSLQTYTVKLHSGSNDTKLTIKAYAGNGDSFIKVDNFTLRTDCETTQRKVGITDARLGEEEASKGEKMKFVVATNTPAPSGGLTLQYKFINKTATTGSDYIANIYSTYSITIPEGQTSAYIYVSIVDDKVKENEESFQIQLQNKDGVVLEKSLATGTIIDNDESSIPQAPVGSYEIRDYGHTDTILRTKIVDETAKIVIKAKSGFKVLHDRKRVTSQNCSTSCICEPCHKKVCSTTCSTYVTYQDIYSSDMNITNIIIHYKDGSTKNLGSLSIKSGEEKTITIPTNKATREAFITIEGESASLYGTNNKTVKLTATSDKFAIRPDKFEIDLAGYSMTNPLKAGKDITFKVKAVSKTGNTVTNYSGNNYKESLTDAKYSGSQLSHGLKLTNSFINGILSQVVDYDEVGELTIKVEEKAPFYAAIDASDNPSTYKISPATYTLKVIPDHFDIDFSMSDFISADKLTFYAQSLSNNYSKLDYSITAKNADNGTTTRYESGKYAYNQNIKVTHTIQSDTKTLDSDTILYYKDSKTDAYTPKFKPKNGVILNLTIDAKKFSMGKTSDTVYENFGRDNKVAKEPMKLNTTKIEVKESNGVSGHLVSGVKNSSSTPPSAYFYYGRAHAPSPQSAVGISLDAKVYYEVYCKNCDKSIFTQAGGSSSIDEVYWYILSNTSDSIYDYSSPRTVNSGASASYHDKSTIKVTATKAPHKNRVYYTPTSSFLQYHRFGTALPEHFFDVAFTRAGNNWAGQGNLGNTVDTNISQQGMHSLEW